MDKDRRKALDSAVAQIERQFGRGSIMRLGSEPVGVLGSGVISS
ncbi:MAG: DNA recombination/repair protein RecA, partial [Anaerolineales bacterium]|nr:DNA recombination/repair protein RecA [Anaerolineales bacterium]